MTSLEEKVDQILVDTADKFNSLPLEKRKEICEYTSEMQILTIWQILNMHTELTNNAWRGKIRKWLSNCVENHQKKYTWKINE